MVITVTAQIAKVGTTSQAHQQGQKHQHKLALRFSNTGHFLQNRIDYFYESLRSGDGCV